MGKTDIIKITKKKSLFEDTVQSKIDIGKTLLEIANLLDPGLSLLRGNSEKVKKS